MALVAPLLEQIDIPLVVKKMNATLLDTSIWRQPPSPEVDAAWNRIQTREAVVISREDVLAMGKDPADAVKWPESFGFGADAYVAKLDVLHQIHCLNTLRMNLRNNFDYYYGAEFPSGMPTDAFHDLHVTHCVHVLLENLMCSGNVDLYTHTWIDAQTHPYADFNINHTCRDFDAILAWQDEHAVPMEKISEVTRPDDYKVHVMNHEFKEIMHWYDDHPDDGVQGGETG
ncbi:hypothetical protein UA08_01389 [Talaromyces atroroseus]|uniref:Tat pathway signal sequence n=1 Tax=Talaromyces atroroseus TaxID=1441469 RepID=A0A1Q5Q9M3_TALAT|nr:hypothetical protein UA08_01389 [Talaromyces atroroseus]OKL62642.1 hypothetical protein UA08_01389 [Talaromyces atroroseus]